MKKSMICLILTFFICSVGIGQNNKENIDSEYKNVLKELFFVTNTEETYKIVIHQMIEQQKKIENR